MCAELACVAYKVCVNVSLTMRSCFCICKMGDHDVSRCADGKKERRGGKAVLKRHLRLKVVWHRDVQI